MKQLGYDVHALIPDYDFLPEVEELGISYDLIRLSRTGVDPWADFRSYRMLKKHIRRYRPDVVYSYSIKPVIYGSLAARACKVPMVAAMITGMGYLFTGETLRQRLLRSVASTLYRRGLSAADRVFFQNPDDLALFRSLNIINGRDEYKIVRTNGSGINLDRFPKSAPPVPPEAPVTFLVIARLLQDKGVREFVAAAGKLHARYPEVRFQVVGPHDPTLPHALPAGEVEQWKRDGIVDFVGGVKDVRPWLKACSVYVLPSYREGTPRSVLEAMATGRPVITTDTPGCRETVNPDENGFLVPVRSADDLASRMEEFIRNPDLITEMGKNSRRLAEQKYDVRKVNRIILEALEIGEPEQSAGAMYDNSNDNSSKDSIRNSSSKDSIRNENADVTGDVSNHEMIGREVRSHG